MNTIESTNLRSYCNYTNNEYMIDKRITNEYSIVTDTSTGAIYTLLVSYDRLTENYK